MCLTIRTKRLIYLYFIFVVLVGCDKPSYFNTELDAINITEFQYTGQSKSISIKDDKLIFYNSKGVDGALKYSVNFDDKSILDYIENLSKKNKTYVTDVNFTEIILINKYGDVFKFRRNETGITDTLQSLIKNYKERENTIPHFDFDIKVISLNFNKNQIILNNGMKEIFYMDLMEDIKFKGKVTTIPKYSYELRFEHNSKSDKIYRLFVDNKEKNLFKEYSDGTIYSFDIDLTYKSYFYGAQNCH